MIENITISYVSYIQSSIIEEMRESSSDLITVICQEGKKLEVSRLLLAALSPYLANLLRTVELEECLLVLPDIQVSYITNIIQCFLNPKDAKLVKESVLNLDGIFWNNEVPSTLADEADLLDCDDVNIFNKYVKLEPEESVHRNLKNCTVKIQRLSNLDLREYTQKQQKRKRIASVNKNKKRKTPKVIITTEEDKNGMQLKVETDNDDEVHENLPDLDDDTFVPDTNDDRYSSESDSEICAKSSCKENQDPDYQLSSDKPKSTEKPKKIYIQKTLHSRYRKKSDRLAALAADLPQDKEFNAAQENLLKELEDKKNLCDPQLVWYKHHKMNPSFFKLENHSRDVKKLCPSCGRNQFITWKSFFRHLRDHKYINFECSCNKKEIKDPAAHLQSVHWNWITCPVCQMIVKPNMMPVHRFVKHNDTKALYCVRCEIYCTRADRYLNHMDSHTSEKETCSCTNVIFLNSSHKKHHMQVVHLKQMLGCSRKKCYFLCGDQETMDRHVEDRHLKVKPKPHNPSVVCDICGLVVKASHIKEHKLRVHKPKIIQCPKCPSKFSEIGLKAHMRNVHELAGICSICGVQVSNVRRHKKVMHEDKKYKCDICQKGFAFMDHLKKHLNTHLKTKVFPCRYGCPFPYVDSSNRNAHERKKHGKSYIKEVKDEQVPDLKKDEITEDDTNN